MSFIKHIDNFDHKNFQEMIKNASISQVKKCLSKDEISLNDLMILLSNNASSLLKEMAVKAHDLTIQRFGKIINFYVPVYLSNECENQCVYCGFNSKRDIVRKTLTIEEIRNEYIKLKKLGFDNVLLLTGEAPGLVGLEYVLEAVKLAKEYFTFVGLEIYPMTEEEYSKLVNAGASGLTIYQETYDKTVYSKMHIKGKKADYNWRLETPSRALNAGFRKIGMGALLGLTNWQYDAFMLAGHADYLQKNYWKGEISLGFPRINPPTNSFKIPDTVSDRDLLQMLCALRLFLPDVGFYITTRESADLRNNLIGLCITQISAGSKTNPGGYSDGQADEQFAVVDDRDIYKMIEIVKSKGYEAVLKDWDVSFAGLQK